MLDERAKTLLKTLVERYIADGQPVGSRTLSRASGLELSPATIRNVMADLEELGLIVSPHTSAGRVPTPRGYRLFVDTMLTARPVESEATLSQLLTDIGGPRDILAGTVQPAALCGLGTGLMFSFTTVFIKLANQSLPGPSLVVKALFAVLVTNTLQTLMQGGWLLWREPAQLRRAFTTWRSSMWVGTLSACGSACWFIGFVLTDVALVRSVGQIEIVFTLLFSKFYLKEQVKRTDIAGLALVVGGVLLIVLGH